MAAAVVVAAVCWTLVVVGAVAVCVCGALVVTACSGLANDAAEPGAPDVDVDGLDVLAPTLAMAGGGVSSPVRVGAGGARSRDAY